MSKRFLIFFILFILMANVAGAYYTYKKEYSLFKLDRNVQKVNYEIFYRESADNEVMLEIVFDKKIYVVSDINNIFLAEDGKKITKFIRQNEKNIILVRDDDFNYQEIEYIVDWLN